MSEKKKKLKRSSDDSDTRKAPKDLTVIKEIKAAEASSKSSSTSRQQNQSPSKRNQRGKPAVAPTPGGAPSGKRGETLAEKKKRRQKRSLKDRFFIWLGYGAGNVVLRDPKAIEAANALRLRPSHLRKLKAKFDTIDIDGSGNIDSEEFF